MYYVFKFVKNANKFKLLFTAENKGNSYQTNGRIDGWMYRWSHRRTDTWTDVRTDGQTDIRTDIRTDGRTDRMNVHM
jgi:hypothetical protein